jgi:hypothetical protein
MTTNQDERSALVAQLRDRADDARDAFDEGAIPMLDQEDVADIRTAAAQIESDGQKLARIREWLERYGPINGPVGAELDAILEGGDDEK